MRIGASLTICLVAVVGIFSIHYASNRQNSDIATPAQVPAAFRALRPVFPFSVVRGGVYSPAELKFQTERDPVVKRHYADFNIESARLVSFNSDHYFYASYRKENQIFWTSRKLRIPKGEVLLTDGTHLARTRCGNRLSETRGGPVSSSEPSAGLSLPTALNDSQIAFAQEPASAPYSNGTVIPFVPLPEDTTLIPSSSLSVTSANSLDKPQVERYMYIPGAAVIPGPGETPQPPLQTILPLSQATTDSLPPSVPPIGPPVPEPAFETWLGVAVLSLLSLRRRWWFHSK